MTEAGVEEQEGRPSRCSSHSLNLRNYSRGMLFQEIFPLLSLFRFLEVPAWEQDITKMYCLFPLTLIIVKIASVGVTGGCCETTLCSYFLLFIDFRKVLRENALKPCSYLPGVSSHSLDFQTYSGARLKFVPYAARIQRDILEHKRSSWHHRFSRLTSHLQI